MNRVEEHFDDEWDPAARPDFDKDSFAMMTGEGRREAQIRSEIVAVTALGVFLCKRGTERMPVHTDIEKAALIMWAVSEEVAEGNVHKAYLRGWYWCLHAVEDIAGYVNHVWDGGEKFYCKHKDDFRRMDEDN